MYDVIVIGAGPGGMTAALNVRREGKSVLVLEKENIGGQIALSPHVENIPSIMDISGEEYSSQIFNQISELGADFELEEVTSINKSNNIFKVTTNYHTYEAKSVIIATGCQHRSIGVPREKELIGHGVSYCAVCDGAFYKDEEVSVIGDANTAIQYAIVLALYCKKVHVCALFDHLFADPILCNKLSKLDNVDVRYNISLKEFVGDDELTGLVFIDTKTNERVEYNSKAVFIAIGQIPHNEIFVNFVDLDKGYILTNELMETKTPGLFAIGDCRMKKYRQVVTSLSDGMIAALQASHYVDLN